MSSESFDPNFVRYRYISERVLSEIVTQDHAGRSRWRPDHVRASVGALSTGLERRSDQSQFDLVRKAEEILDFGSLSQPGTYIADRTWLEGFVLTSSEDSYRTAFMRTGIRSDRLLVMIGSLKNVLGAEALQVPSPTGFLPSWAGGLAPMLDLFSTRRGRKPPRLAIDEDSATSVARQAADFAYELGADDDSDVRFCDEFVEFACQVWFRVPEVEVASFRRGSRTTFAEVLVGTPLWVRDPAPQPLA